MKFSVCLPTGFEGVMHPVPFVKPEDFVRLAKKCEALGYHSAWGNDHINSQRYGIEGPRGRPLLCADVPNRHNRRIRRADRVVRQDGDADRQVGAQFSFGITSSANSCI